MQHIDYIFTDKADYRPGITVDKLRRPTPDEWRLILCEADGNCFYHALSKSLSSVKDAKTARMDIIDYLINNEHMMPNRKKVLRRVYSGIEKQMKGLTISHRSWANHEEIQICARIYNVVICVWNAEFQMWTACFPRDDLIILSQCRKVVYLHHDGSHFNVLTRRISEI